MSSDLWDIYGLDKDAIAVSEDNSLWKEYGLDKEFTTSGPKGGVGRGLSAFAEGWDTPEFVSGLWDSTKAIGAGIGRNQLIESSKVTEDILKRQGLWTPETEAQAKEKLTQYDDDTLKHHTQLAENQARHVANMPLDIQAGGAPIFPGKPWFGKPLTTADMYNLPESLTLMAPAIAGGAITKGRGGGKLAQMGVTSGMFGVPIFAKIYGEQDPNMSHEDKLTEASWGTTFEVVPELIPFATFLGPLKGIIKNIVMGAGAEYISEALTETAYITREILKANPHIAENPTENIEEFIELFSAQLPRVGHAGKVGAFIGAPFGGAAGAGKAITKRLAGREDPTTGEVEYDDVPPVVGPPGPATTVTGPPSPKTPVDLELAEEGAPLNVSIATEQQEQALQVSEDLTPDQQGIYIDLREQGADHNQAMKGALTGTTEFRAPVTPVVEGVGVSTTSTGAETRLDAIEGSEIDASGVEVPRRGLGDADPVSQRGFSNMFQDIISRITFGGEDAQAEYNRSIQSIAKSTGETTEEYNAKNKEFQLLDEKSPGQSVIITDDGTRIKVREQLTVTNKEGEKEEGGGETLNAVAALRARNDIFNKNFNDFVNEIKRYHQHYGKLDKDLFGRDQLSIVIDLGGAGMDAAASYSGRNHEITLNVGQLMAGIGESPVRALDETAIHELVHMKLYTLFEKNALQNVKDTPEYRNFANILGTEYFKNASNEVKEEIFQEIVENRNHLLENETLKLTDNFGRRLVKPMRKEIIRFLDARWARAKEIGDNPSRFIANALGLTPNTDLYNKIQEAKNTKQIFNILAKSIESGERMINIREGKTENLQVSVSYPIIHELLAYESMTLDTLLEKGKVPTSRQKEFINKFLRVAKQALNQMLGDVQVTREDVAEFINTLFLETAGALPAGAIEETKISKIAKAQPEPSPLSGEAGFETPVISRMADEKIDLSKRRFVKQVAGAAAGAVVDPTILAEPAAKAAAAVASTVVEPHAISTTYRFAVSVPVETRQGELVEGEAIVDIDYDSETNHIRVVQIDEDAYPIIDEGYAELEIPIENPTMRQVDDFAAQIIKTGKNPLDPKARLDFDPKAVYSVQPPMRDPHHEELADEDRVMNEQDLEEYTEVDKNFLKNISGEKVEAIDAVDPNRDDVGDPSYQAQFTEYGGTPPRVTLEGEPVGPAERLMTDRPEDTLIAPRTDVASELEKVNDTMSVIQEAIEQISNMTIEDIQGKPVEGEVIPAKRKRTPGMAEEETMQDLRDALAGSEERLERLQDVGRDEDVETIEEYEAEIEAYKKDIKDLKEELKEVGATLPRKEGEGPPIISRMVEPDPQAEKQISSILLHHGGSLETAGKLKPPIFATTSEQGAEEYALNIPEGEI